MQMICKNKINIGIWSSGCSDIRTGKEEAKLQEDRLPNLNIGERAVASLCAKQDTKTIGALIIYVIFNDFALNTISWHHIDYLLTVIQSQ